MTTAEAFRRTCERNALRREARLPLIDIRDGIAEELRRDALIAYGLAADHYREVYLRIRQEVLDELRAERGPDFGPSAGGRWIVDHFAGRRFDQFLAGKGFVRPPTRGVSYGSKRKG
jgi:hypothetical protein